MKAEGAATPAAWADQRERSNRFLLLLMRRLALALGRRNARVLLHPIACWFVLDRSTRLHSARYLSRALARPAITLAAGQNSPKYVAVDSASVYWTNYGDGSVAKVSLAGGTPTTLAPATGSHAAAGIAVDDSCVYWANPIDNAVLTVPK